MKRLFIFWVILLPALTQHVHAQYYSVNYDARTVAAMAAAFGTEAVAESYYREQVDDILKHYTAAEVAAAGIFSSKFLEHKALSDLGIWCSSTENYYYRRIYHMVAEKIMPKIWVVAKLMLRSPQTAIHWGSYLMKVCDDTKSLCMQFESVVTNSTLSFSDIAFLEIDRDIATLLNLAELGGTDWQRMLDNFTKVPGNFTIENLKGDIDNLYNMGVGLATSGMENLGDKDFAVLLDAHFLQENIHDNQRDQRKKQRVIFYAVDFEDHERLVEQRAVHVLVQRFFVVAAQIEVLHHIAVCREVDARDTVLLTDIRDALHGIFIERVE
jgi:hypothetical protein